MANIAQTGPLQTRPTWVPDARFFSTVLARPADPGLRKDLSDLRTDTLDDL